MHILTHPVHTSWEYEFAKTGHEIFTIAPDDFEIMTPDYWGSCHGTLTRGPIWNTKDRPFPDNVRVISLAAARRMHFDVCMVHTASWLEKIKDISCPIIFKVHVIPPADLVPAWAEKIIAVLSFNNEMAMHRVVTKHPIPKTVIPVPIDPVLFSGYTGIKEACLAISHLVTKRPEKKVDRLTRIHALIPLHLFGGGNQDVPCAVGEASSFHKYVSLYQTYAVFLDVADHVSMSRLEAMMTGMPIVIFPPEYHRDLFIHDYNCLIVETERAAAQAIRYLFQHPEERKRLGDNARNTVLARFHSESFREQWNTLLHQVVSHTLL